MQAKKLITQFARRAHRAIKTELSQYKITYHCGVKFVNNIKFMSIFTYYVY